MARSQHSRLDEVLIRPTEDHDPQRAAVLCSEVTRRALRDFAPALVFLTPRDRRRLQAVAAFGLTLFDFARQSSLEGERLAQINRWRFDLELTLEGEPPGQPVFVLLAATDEEPSWPREALDRLVGCASRRAVQQRLGSAEAVDRQARQLAEVLSAALAPEADRAAAHLVAALLRVRRLVDLGEDRRRHQAGLGTDELPESWQAQGPLSAGELTDVIRLECDRLDAALEATQGLASLPKPWRRALTYGVLGARRLVARARDAGADVLEAPPTLGALERLGLLLRSRLSPF